MTALPHPPLINLSEGLCLRSTTPISRRHYKIMSCHQTECESPALHAVQSQQSSVEGLIQIICLLLLLLLLLFLDVNEKSLGQIRVQGNAKKRG